MLKLLYSTREIITYSIKKNKKIYIFGRGGSGNQIKLTYLYFIRSINFFFKTSERTFSK